MFEDSTFESTGRIRTRSRGWMVAAFAFNGSILIALVLIPLIDPEALPRMRLPFLVAVPAPAAPQPVPQPVAHPFKGAPEIQDGHIFAPTRIPISISIFKEPERSPAGNALFLDSGAPDGSSSLFHAQAAPRVVHPDAQGPVRVSSAIEAGLLIQKTMPQYPPMARAMRLEGTVVLAATISRMGTIENLHVTSGPPVLQQAALDAVSTWRYRPYLLDGQPVEVETTVNVIFTMGR